MRTTDKPVKPAAPTPENTPVPGGGRWRWAGDRWLEVTEAPQPTPAQPEELE